MEDKLITAVVVTPRMLATLLAREGTTFLVTISLTAIVSPLSKTKATPNTVTVKDMPNKVAIDPVVTKSMDASNMESEDLMVSRA